MNSLNRRTFIKRSALGAATVGLAPVLATQTAPSTGVAGANGDIRCAVVGFNGRGKEHISEIQKYQGARLVALCDVDQDVLDREVKKAAGEGTKLEAYRDIRKLLESRDIDVVTFATPNHWHSLGSIWAMQAGKDIYVEKPVSHNVWEGRQLVAAARKYGRIAQGGTQSRSSSGIAEGIQFIRDGNLGKLLRVRAIVYKRRPSIGKVDGPQPIPPSIDYDLWCGPAPKDPLMRKRLHYDWHWVWPTGNGDLGNQGVHEMDVARWMSGHNELSPSVLAIGGRLGYEDDGTTPNTLVVLHNYKDVPVFFELRGLPTADGETKMDNFQGASIGIVGECEGGMLVVPEYNSAIARDTKGTEIKRFKGATSHMANFLDAVRSRRSGDLKAEVLEGHLSAGLCHTAHISYRLGKTQSPAEIKEAIKGNTELGEAIGRMEQHLAANKVDLTKTPATLGALLKMDPKSEEFDKNEAANKMLTRIYRAPYVVPQLENGKA